MKIEDYNKYYIQWSDHYLIPKDIFTELFNEMNNWKEESKKEVIDKAIKYVETMYIPQDVISQKQELLDILKEDPNVWT